LCKYRANIQLTADLINLKETGSVTLGPGNYANEAGIIGAVIILEDTHKCGLNQ